MPTTKKVPAGSSDDVAVAILQRLERATSGLFALNVSVLERMEKRIGLAPLRALQALDRLGPSLVTELGADLDLLPSTASRLSDRLADAGVIAGAAGNDSGLFMGILARYLAQTALALGDTTAAQLVHASARAAWGNRAEVDGLPLFGADWSRPVTAPATAASP